MSTKTKALYFLCANLVAVLVFLCAAPPNAAADGDDPPERVARLSFLRGEVSFQPAGESDWDTARINRPMTTGDKLWADRDSLAELKLGSAAIRLDGNTGFSFLNLDDRTVQIQLSAGTLAIRVRRLERDEVFEIDTPNQAFTILRPGRYRLEATEDGDNTIITVQEGEGEATGAGRTYTLESRDKAYLTGRDVLSADINRVDRRDSDDFDDWCEERDRRWEESRSAHYVSPEMVGYEDLDENGRWRYDPVYGQVWVPTAVPVGWAPYHYGHWAWIAPWGWTWVDDAPWGYAPFHYGRWAYGEGAWFWVPGPVAERPVYAPALVAFVGGPNFGVAIGVGGGAAVAWFPLGPREVYVPAYRTSPAYVTRVNVSNTTVNQVAVTNVYNSTVVNNTTVVNNVTYVNRTAPGAVTAVPTTAFANAQPVAAAAVRVNPNQIAAAPVVTRAAVAPTQNSVLGSAEHKPPQAVPPAALVDRPVVAKATPPPPPVSFARQQQALAAHPGQPLARNEVETLRPAEAAHPLVRPATPNQQAPSRGAGQVAGAPGAPNREDRGNGRSNGIGNGPTNNPSANAPGRNDQPRPGQQNRPEQPVSAPRANSEPANNRPAINQPSYRPPSSESRPPSQGASSNERPSANPQQQSAPDERPNRSYEPANQQPNRPATAAPAPENRPPADHAEGNVRSAPENRAPAAQPRSAPAKSNKSSSNDKDKEKEKRN